MQLDPVGLSSGMWAHHIASSLITGLESLISQEAQKVSPEAFPHARPMPCFDKTRRYRISDLNHCLIASNHLSVHYVKFPRPLIGACHGKKNFQHPHPLGFLAPAVFGFTIIYLFCFIYHAVLANEFQVDPPADAK